MKINNKTPAWIARYDIESEYGRLECTFYPEQTSGHFYDFFSAFAEGTADYLSAHPSFEKYADHATKLFAELFPQRLKELLEETVDEVRLRTLVDMDGLTREAAAAEIERAVRDAQRDKKQRMNAPKAGRPKEWTKKTLKEAVKAEISKIPQSRGVTLHEVAKKLNLPSEDALRKLLKSYDLEWKELKKRSLYEWD